MAKILTSNQVLGEIGETAVRRRFLNIGFQFDGRSRLEAGIDGIAEVMIEGQPMAQMIAVQVKATESARYTAENEHGFTYLLRSKDLEYWRPANLPVIIVLYRKSDETFYWQEVPRGISQEDRRLQFDKRRDVLDRTAVDRLANLTVPKAGFGYYIPPLGDGEEALVNILPITLPQEIFVSSTPHSGGKAAALLLEGDEPARFDWVIRGGSFWSFHDPRMSVCRDVVNLDQVEAVEAGHLAFHEDLDEQHHFKFLLMNTLRHQVRADLNWHRDNKLFYFKARKADTPRRFHYDSAKNKTHADVVNVTVSKKEENRVDFVRHHAFAPRFELLGDQWYLVIEPTYFFTINGFKPHSYPQALLSGKKRMDNSGSLRGQVIMWHRFLTKQERENTGLFALEDGDEPCLRFGEPPQITLDTRVPEDVWGSPKKKPEELEGQERFTL